MNVADRDRFEESAGVIPIRTPARNSFTALSGGGQSGATQLTADYCEVNTVAADGDSVMLPKGYSGQECILINNGAKNLAVFPYTGEKINAQSANASVSQMPGSVVLYVCLTPGNWYTTGLGVGFSGSYEVYSVKDAITAHAGGTQAGAQGDANSQLPAMNNRIGTCATGGDSTVLPVSKPGMYITVANDGAASCNVFPQTGETINQGGANAAFAVGVAKAATFFCVVAGKWHAVLSA